MSTRNVSQSQQIREVLKYCPECKATLKPVRVSNARGQRRGGTKLRLKAFECPRGHGSLVVR